MTEVEIRAEEPDDHPAVERIHRLAFGRSAEAELVAALRRESGPRLSLVAERAGQAVGHVFFSPVTIEGAADPPPAAGLAPLAVLPEAQARGVGGALVRSGLGRCRSLGWRAVFLLGEPAYYGRFGFVLAAPRGLHYESPAFDAAFQLLELEPSALDGCRGQVRYAPPFTAV